MNEFSAARSPGGKVLVAGGAGYVGSILVPLLVEAGYSVVVLDRFFFGDSLAATASAKRGSLKLVRADIRDVDDSVLEGVDSVVDLCGISNDPACDLDPAVTTAINVGGASRLIELALTVGVRRYVYASSCSVYGYGERLQMTEATQCSPQTLYAQSKLKIEQLLLAKGRCSSGIFQPVVLRLGTLFGVSPRMRFDLALNAMVKSAYAEGKICVDGDGLQWRPFVHVGDAASAFIIALNAPSRLVSNRVFNIGVGENNWQIRDLAIDIQLCLPGSVIAYSKQCRDSRNYNVDFAAAKTELGFSASTSVKQGIHEVIEAIGSGKVDLNDERSNTVRHYRALFAQSGLGLMLPVVSVPEASIA
ncbi:NAD-dependent epimerase/dehydratase family protein [Pigmentiphaga litoralis]|uniref:Nucleoside-diphosphate-sugar epimerase n=1 Tax=Pigmentiphaga litoralis TaxID=516702 RepID=A0A7Y9ISG3_9BURK|nr:SDR family oxidoreductase [Pigmentiphaga litoralis]NYE24239.1 nucleoside-diphosphate-sugar epimerase [Pigmentiphaga litoralis]NYE82147.1 nucleoside-diphosphate-sugar epimerase [Pigmentiphaga litoralis]